MLLTRDDFGVVNKPARGKKSFIAEELSDHFGHAGAVTVVDVINGEHVVHATAANQVTRGREHRCHDPRRPQRNNLLKKYFYAVLELKFAKLHTMVLLPVQQSQTISLPSNDPVTRCLLSPEKWQQVTLLM